MDRQRFYIRTGVILLLSITLLIGVKVEAADYHALTGLKDIKVVFDVRGRNPKPLALQLDLIQKTYFDPSIRKVTKTPQIAVVFGGGAVKLISSEREDFDDDEKRLLDLIQDKLAELNRYGIRLEVCLFAADVHDVDQDTIPEFIHRVDNGWISVLGYQQKGYSLVPVF